jgi:hypothetical protein
LTQRVDIGVPCYGAQHHEWWGQIFGDLLAEERAGLIRIGAIRAVGSALPDHNKNIIADDRRGVGNRWELDPHRPNLTDMNRSAIAGGFLSGEADWLWMLDDDIVPPDGCVSHLMGLGHSLVGGVCFNGNPPHNVTAYFRGEDGLYHDAVIDFAIGAILKVDSVGMGCTLIHRSVFEKIMSTHEVWMRPTGSLMPIAKRIIKDRMLPGDNARMRLENGYLHIPMRPVDPVDNRPWPFFSMEYGRTEDHHFCEMAVEAGVRPYVDTSVMTSHLKTKPINRSVQLRALEDYGIREAT